MLYWNKIDALKLEIIGLLCIYLYSAVYICVSISCIWFAFVLDSTEYLKWVLQSQRYSYSMKEILRGKICWFKIGASIIE